MTGSRQTQTVLGGTAIIVLLVIAPSIRAVFLNSSHLMENWKHAMWFTPAFYLYAFASMMAIAMPVAAAVRCLPLLRAHDATLRVLLTMLGASLGIALAAVLFWQLLAWASYPILAGGKLRLLPLYPWPESGFWRHFLHFPAGLGWLIQEYGE